MRSKQAGSSMVELIVAVTIGMFAMSAFFETISRLTALDKAKREAAQLSYGAAALQSMLKNHGANIIKTGTASGFVNPLKPTFSELKAGRYLPPFAKQTSAFNGSLDFTIRRGAKNDLFGLVCDTQSITERGAPATWLASEVMMAADGLGLRTSIATPTTLSGQAFSGVLSPITGPAVVCAWAYVGAPT